jgi:TP901 family phage tail tape measure protein
VQKLGAAFGALGIGAALQGSLNSFANFERGLIGVGKTSDITGDALTGLGQSIRELSRDLPVTSAELLAIAQSAGQLGVSGTDNILRFTETVGKLGLASDLSGEQAATSLARILTVTGTAISEVDRLGSTIVQLGNNFAATESEIADVATRVAQSTSQFRVSAADVLGISTALKAVGVEAESGGTQIGLSFQAINDALRNGGEELNRLQEITGRTGDALRQDFFNGESAKVFEDFVKGLGNIQASGGDVSAALNSLGLNGSQAVQVLSTLATRTDVLSDALSQANTEYEANVALNKEAAVASTSFSAQLQLVGNAADEAASAIGSIIAPAALEGLSTFRDASLAVAENIDEVADAAAAVAILIGGKLAGALAIGAAAFVTNTKASLLSFAATTRAANTQAILAQGLIRRTASEKLAVFATLDRARAEVAATAGTQANAAALVRQTAAVDAATIAAARHTVALSANTVVMGAGAVAAGVLTRAMALLGGPVGVLIIAAASLYYFRDAIFSTKVELGEAGEAVRGFTDGLQDMTSATVESNRQSLAQQMRENTIAIAEAGAELDRLQEKQKSQNVSNQGRPGAATAQMREAQQEVAVLTKLGVVMGEQFEKLNERANQLATTAAESSASAADSIAATAEAAASAAEKVTAALIVELEYLRLQNGLVEAGISASKIEIAIMETKRELMLEAQGLTAAQAVEYVALEKAIALSLSAQREEDQMLQNLRDQYGDTTKAARDFTAQVKLLSDLLLATGDPEIARILKRLADDFNDAGKKAAEEFKNPFESAAQSVSQSLQDAIASGDFGSLGEGVGNAFAASFSAVVSKSITDTLSEGLTKDSSAISQISAAFAGPIAGAVVGGVVQLAVAELADFFSFGDFDPTADRQAAQGTGTILGSIDAKSDSIAKATELTASTNEELVNINTGMLRALQSVQEGIAGAAARVARGAGAQQFNAPSVSSGQFEGLIAGGALGAIGGATLGLALGATAGATGALAVAAVLGPAGLIVGALLGPTLGKLFGGKSKQVDEGIRITGGAIQDLIENTVVEGFATFRVKKNIVSSTKTKEKFQSLGDDVSNQFALVFESLVDSVSEGAAAIGLLPADVQSALDQFRVETQKISLENLNAGEQTDAIQEVFGVIFDNLASAVVPFLDDFQRAGEGLGETLARVATQVQLTAEAATTLGFALDNALGAEMVAGISDSLVKLVGGIEAFSTAITSFESNFFTEAEQFDINARRLTQAMGDLPLAETRQGFVDLLQAQDVTTISGREAVATLLRLQGSADDYYSYLEDASEAAAQLALDALNGIRGATDSALGDLQRLVNDRKSVLQEGYNAEVALIQEQTSARLEANQLVLDAAKAGMQAIQQELTGITSASNRLRGNFEPAQAGLRSNALATLSAAIASGDLTGTDQAAGVAIDINAGAYTNSAEYRAEQARTLFTLSLLQSEGQSQLTVAEQSVQRLEEHTTAIREESERQILNAEQALNAQLMALDALYTEQLNQVNELRGIRAGVLGVEEAIAALASAIQAESGLTVSTVPGFASGGMHSGGLRIVGERGPELEATGSSKIMSNSELMSSLGGNQKLADEMRAMHSDMMLGLNTMAKTSNKISRQLERWDLTGLPATREFV